MQNTLDLRQPTAKHKQWENEWQAQDAEEAEILEDLHESEVVEEPIDISTVTTFAVTDQNGLHVRGLMNELIGAANSFSLN